MSGRSVPATPVVYTSPSRLVSCRLVRDGFEGQVVDSGLRPAPLSRSRMGREEAGRELIASRPMCLKRVEVRSSHGAGSTLLEVVMAVQEPPRLQSAYQRIWLKVIRSRPRPQRQSSSSPPSHLDLQSRSLLACGRRMARERHVSDRGVFCCSRKRAVDRYSLTMSANA